jgi:hemophore-related protein
MIRPRIAAGVAVAAAALFLVPATAGAAPTDPVPGTNCNVGQVERATQAIAPEALTALDSLPGGRASAEKFLTATPDQRQQQLPQLEQSNPMAYSYYKSNKSDVDAKIAKVVAECPNY